MAPAMLLRRLKTPGLAHHAYVLELAPGTLAVVDPRRDIAEVLAIAREASARIAWVLVTHRQEDFESGAAALAAVSGAQIVAGAHPLAGRADRRLRDGEALEAGPSRVVALETPGHTPESVCYAVYRRDAGDACWGVFSGDTLFVGAAGRTDLADPAATAENAGRLYDAVQAKLAPLGPQALLFPAHGSGSACGTSIAQRDDSTLGIEMRTNPAFTLSREAFMRHMAAQKLPRPPYFAHMEKVNLEGGRALPELERVRLLPPRELAERARGGIVIDTRAPDAFAAAHVPGAYNIWLAGLSSFGGWIAQPGARIYLVTGAAAELEPALLALARVGIDGIEGALAGGVSAWREAGLPLGRLGTIGAAQANERRGDAAILDVRDEHEWHEGHIPGALHRYVGELERRPPGLAPEREIIVHCSVGNRSGLAASVLARAGFSRVHNMLGGFKAWKSLGLPVQAG